MRRELRREVAFFDLVTRMIDYAVPSARELEILRIDRHVIVDTRSVCNTIVIVLR